MNQQIWDNTRLEPVLITYNRAKFLERTLQAFLDAGLSGMKLHVLDNASPDETKGVFQKFHALWPSLHYHRNKYNIGGNGNILRATEITDSEYCWIIGDDDEWHLEDLAELKSEIEKGQADIIRLGWLVSEEARGRILPARELAEREEMFFASVSMISATILKRSVVAKYLPHAYMNTGDAYPQLVSILMATEEQRLDVYTVRKNLLTHTPNAAPGYYFGDLEWYAGWFRTSRFIQDPRLKKKFIGEVIRYMTRSRPGVFSRAVWLTKVALNYKALGIDQIPYLLTMLAYGKGRRGRILVALLAYLSVPQWLAKWLRTVNRRFHNRPERSVYFDRSRL